MSSGLPLLDFLYRAYMFLIDAEVFKDVSVDDLAVSLMAATTAGFVMNFACVSDSYTYGNIGTY